MSVPFNKSDLERVRALLTIIEAKPKGAEISIYMARTGGYVSIEIKSTALTAADVAPVFGLDAQEEPETLPVLKPIKARSADDY
jgi:hypothetical protein